MSIKYGELLIEGINKKDGKYYVTDFLRLMDNLKPETAYTTQYYDYNLYFNSFWHKIKTIFKILWK